MQAKTRRQNAIDAKGDNIKTAMDYSRMLVARLLIQKSFPRLAVRDKIEGAAKIEFLVARDGKLLSNRIVTSSGSAILDQGALDTIQRAQPFPQLVVDKESDVFTVPLVYRIPKKLPYLPAAGAADAVPDQPATPNSIGR